MKRAHRIHRIVGLALVAASLSFTAPMPGYAAEKKAVKAATPVLPLGPPLQVTVDGNKLNLPDGTSVKLQVKDTLASNKSKTGDKVEYVVEEDVVDVEKRVLIRKGAPATGVITLAKGRGGLGRSGKLEFTCENVLAVDGNTIPLRGDQAKRGKSGKASMVAVTLLLSPLGLFMKGKNITVKQGTVITAYVDSVPETAALPATTTAAAK